jgi:hypothetical protein
MSDSIAVDVFVEDRAHEAFFVPLLERVATEEGVSVSSLVRSGRGGHGRSLTELRLYQRIVSPPDLLIVGIDGNCSTFTKARQVIRAATEAPFSDRLVVACPDPHVERWYLADPESFKTVVGQRPSLGRKKCVRDYYKDALAKAVRQAGHPPTLGGIEFAREIVESMDLFRAGKNDRSLKAFVDDLRSSLRTFRASRPGRA